MAPDASGRCRFRRRYGTVRNGFSRFVDLRLREFPFGSLGQHLHSSKRSVVPGHSIRPQNLCPSIRSHSDECVGWSLAP
jgi:hypothetical protein